MESDRWGEDLISVQMRIEYGRLLSSRSEESAGGPTVAPFEMPNLHSYPKSSQTQRAGTETPVSGRSALARETRLQRVDGQKVLLNSQTQRGEQPDIFGRCSCHGHNARPNVNSGEREDEDDSRTVQTQNLSAFTVILFAESSQNPTTEGNGCNVLGISRRPQQMQLVSTLNLLTHKRNGETHPMCNQNTHTQTHKRKSEPSWRKPGQSLVLRGQGDRWSWSK